MLKPMVEVRNEGGILFAEFWDCLRLDPAPVRDLKAHLEQHIRSHGRPDLVVDLNGVSYAGSASLGGFIVLHRLTVQHGGRVVFCNVDDNVFEVFNVSKLTPLFVFTKDRAAALACLTTPADFPATPPSAPAAGPPKPRSDGPLRRSRPRGPENGSV